MDTQSTSKVGAYTIDLVGTASSVSNKFTFVVNVIDSCAALTINTVAIGSPQSYAVDSGSPKVLGATAFTLSSTLAYCPSITYTLLDTPAGSPSLFTISGGNVVVNSNSASDIGTYTLRLKGTYGTAPVYDTEEISFTVNVVNGCSAVTVNPVPFTTP